MLARALLLLTVAVGACQPPQSKWAAQKRHAQSLSAAPVGQRGPARQVTASFRVRVWADQDYRTRRRWRDRIEEQIERVNGVIGPAFGANLAAEVVDWERAAGGSDDLEVILGELRARDPGQGVDFVFGYVGPPQAFTTAHHHLGMADLLGTHLVVRDMNDAAEMRRLNEVFTTLSEKDRLDLYTNRKLHKELLVLLHEWGHTVGAIHEQGARWIMNPHYDNDGGEFSEATARLLDLGVQLRAQRGEGAGAARKKLAAELLAHVESTEWADWDPAERERLVAALRSATPVDDPLTTEDRKTFNEAADRARADQHAWAWDLAAPLVAKYAENAEVQLFGCQLAAQVAVKAPASRGACEQAAKLLPADHEPLVLLAFARVNEDNPKAAFAALELAAARLEQQQAKPPAGAWTELVRLWLHIGAYARADAGLVHAGSGKDALVLRDAVLAARREVGLAPGQTTIAAADEPEYVAEYRYAYARLMADELGSAKKAAQRGLKRFPGAAGLLAIQCGVELFSQRLRPAAKLCKQALAAWDETVLAHFLSSQVAERSGRPAEAIHHLERTIELDPEQRIAWTSLAELYAAAGEHDKLAELKKRYTARFHSSL